MPNAGNSGASSSFRLCHGRIEDIVAATIIQCRRLDERLTNETTVPRTRVPLLERPHRGRT